MIVRNDRLPDRYEFDDSVFATEGTVYDLGCLRWEWFAPFAGRKRYVGVDPHETTCPKGAELVRAAVSPFGGTVTMQGAGLQAVCTAPTDEYNNHCGYADGRVENVATGIYTVPAITWGELTAQYGKAAMVKINIEGAEIPLLMTAPMPIAPQLIVAFHRPGHDYSQPAWPQAEAVTACIRYLQNWYDITMTELYHSEPDRWHLCQIR